MTEEYRRGWNSEPLNSTASLGDQDAWKRGYEDRMNGREPEFGSAFPSAPPPQRESSLQGVYDAGYSVGVEYAGNPNATVNAMLKVIAGATVIAGLVGFGLATLLGPSWAASPTAWAVGFALVTFWLVAIYNWAMLTLFLLHRRTRRAVIVWLVLAPVLGFMLWSFLSSMIRGWTS